MIDSCLRTSKRILTIKHTFNYNRKTKTNISGIKLQTFCIINSFLLHVLHNLKSRPTMSDTLIEFNTKPLSFRLSFFLWLYFHSNHFLFALKILLDFLFLLLLFCFICFDLIIVCHVIRIESFNIQYIFILAAKTTPIFGSLILKLCSIFPSVFFYANRFKTPRKRIFFQTVFSIDFLFKYNYLIFWIN